MSGIEPIAALGPALAAPSGVAGSSPADSSFLNALAQGIARVEADNARASAALANLAVNAGAPTHDVILAMEQAKLSLQLAAEVRQRLLDAYKELVSMQI